MPHRSVEWLLAARVQANCLDRSVSGAGPGGVADVVRRTAGLQAQSWRGAAFAVRARSVATSRADVDTAREIDRSVVRSWFQRGTLHLVATEDAGPLLGLLGPKLIKDTSRRYAELGLTPELRNRTADVLEDHLTENGPTGRADLGAVLVDAGLLAEPTGQAVYASLHHAGLLGRICYGPGHDATETWVATEAWLGHPLSLDPMDPAELARRYLTAYGPATVQDFATWSGLSMAVARKAVQEVDPIELRVGDEELYAVADLPGSKDLRLLGEFDPYLLGYKDRGHALPEGFRRRIQPGGGMLKPAVVRAGRVIGAWRHGHDEIDLFEPAARPPRALAAELADVQRFEN